MLRVLVLLVLSCGKLAGASSNLVVVSETTSTNDEHHPTYQDRNAGARAQLGDSSSGGLSSLASGQFDAASLIDFGLNPMGSAAKFLMPGTLQGLASDANNGVSMLTQGAQQGFGGVQSSLGSLSDGLNKRYLMLQQAFAKRYQNSDEMLRLAYEALTSPQSYCTNWLSQQSSQLASLANSAGLQLTQSGGQTLKQLGQEVDSTLAHSGSLAGQAAQQSGNFLSKLGAYAFGR